MTSLLVISRIRDPVAMVSNSSSKKSSIFQLFQGPFVAYQVQMSSGDHGYLLINRSIRSSYTIPIRRQGYQTGARSPWSLTPHATCFNFRLSQIFFFSRMSNFWVYWLLGVSALHYRFLDFISSVIPSFSRHRQGSDEFLGQVHFHCWTKYFFNKLLNWVHFHKFLTILSNFFFKTFSEIFIWLIFVSRSSQNVIPTLRFHPYFMRLFFSGGRYT
jgi:hypothetical protein